MVAVERPWPCPAVTAGVGFWPASACVAVAEAASSTRSPRGCGDAVVAVAVGVSAVVAAVRLAGAVTPSGASPRMFRAGFSRSGSRARRSFAVVAAVAEVTAALAPSTAAATAVAAAVTSQWPRTRPWP